MLKVTVKFFGPWQIYFKEAQRDLEVENSACLKDLILKLRQGQDPAFDELWRTGLVFGDHGENYRPLSEADPLSGIPIVLLLGPVAGG